MDAKMSSQAVRQVFHQPDLFGSSLSNMFRPVVVDASPRARFKGNIEAHHVDGGLIAHVEVSPHDVLHSIEKDAGANADDAIKIFVPTNGTAVLTQAGRDARLDPGALGFVATDSEYSVSTHSGFESLILMLPRQELGLHRDNVSELTANSFDAGHGIEAVVVPYLTQLAGNLGLLAGPGGKRLVRTTSDLVGTLLLAQLAPRLSEAQASRAALFEEAREYIRSNLHERSLSPGLIASELFISPRHLRMIFAEYGETVTGFVRSQRLEAARIELCDPAQAHLTISDIAASFGFSDGAHFTRTFKDRFGSTPSDFRGGSEISVDG